MAEISVIVPVYNVERYLAKCLDSIISQTFKDIEIICVNDGSTDISRRILEEYKNKDSRIKIVDKENGGLSSARNAGMKVATGKFYSFIDSDDWVEPDMLEKLYKNITELNTDISICAVHLYDETNQTINDNEKYFNLEHFDSSFDGKAFSYQDVKPFIMDVCVMAWNKLYRKSFIDECKAEYPEGLIFEDGPFFFSIFFKTKRVSIIRDFLYYYRINRPGSIVQKGGKKFLDIIDVVELMYNSIKDSDCFNDIKNEFYRRKADDIIYRYDLIDVIYKGAFSKKLRKKKFLFDDTIFDFDYIKEHSPYTLKNLYNIKRRTNLLAYYWSKKKVKIMYKVMQILYTEPDVYYFKYRKLVFRIKRRDDWYNCWYANDRLYFLLKGKYQMSIKFEYSELERSQ